MPTVAAVLTTAGFGCIQDAAGRSGIVHAGRRSANTGIVRCPTTADVHTAWRDAADLFRRRSAAIAATATRTAPLSAASMKTGSTLWNDE
jgi:hypothetical protein